MTITFSQPKQHKIHTHTLLQYFLAIHFVSLGCEYHHQLSIRSLKFEKDENDIEYVTISHETHKKITKGG